MHKEASEESEQLAMRLEEQFNILIASFFIVFDDPEVISMGLSHLQTQCATIKHGVSTYDNSSHINVLEDRWRKSDFATFLLHIHLSQHDALLGLVNGQQMHAFRLSQRDGSSHRFPINGQVHTSSLVMRSSERLCKKRPHALFHLLRISPMAQNPTPGAVMRHALSFEMEELTQFLGAQFGPMSHSTTAILTRQFC